jgi:glycolate oxidase FAD binding subunit
LVSTVENRGSDGPPALGANLRERVGTEDDAVDAVVPRFVVHVTSIAEIEQVVARARSEKLAVVAVGGGTLLDIGNAPQRFDMRLDVSGLKTSIEHAPDDLVVSAHAGVSLAALNESLAAAGQRVALSAPDPARSTLGGIAAADFADGTSHAYGRPRDQVLGMTVIDGRGRCIRVGGRVVKNVAGYDLPRLFVGSFGTLGVIVDLTLRTRPLPERSEAIRVGFDDWDGLEQARAALFGCELPSTAVDLEIARISDRWQRSLHLRLEGTDAEVTHQRARVAALCSRGVVTTGFSPADATQAFMDSVILRMSGRAARSVALAAALIDAAGEAGLTGRVSGECGGACLRWHSGDAGRPSIELVRRIAPRHGYGVVVERALPTDKRDFDVWGDEPAGLAIMKRLKAKFDPGGIFAPGRFVGGI